MTDREVMQMALEALESLFNWQVDHERGKRCGDAVVALRAQLEQPEQEPVALIRDGVLCWHIPNEHYSRPAWTAHGTHMLYIAQGQQQAEPVGEVIDERGEVDYISYVPPVGTALYTSPPQRKPLTDAEIAAIVREAAKGSAIKRDGSTSERIARAIEQAHGIGEKQ